jgi:hypothetical protein
MTTITVMPGVVAAYTVSPWISTQACEPKKDNKHITLADGASQSNSNATSKTKQRRGYKHEPATPDGNDEIMSDHQKQKKPCCAVRVDATAEEKTGLGMFYLKNASMNLLDVFPKDMLDSNGANFTYKGKECSNIDCNFIHPRRPSELKQETILAITNHFNKRDIGWINKYHFMKMNNITNEAKKPLGNTIGPNSKMA